MLSASMLLLILILRIDVTFSTPTGDFTHNHSVMSHNEDVTSTYTTPSQRRARFAATNPSQKSLATVTFQAHVDNTRLRAKLQTIPFHGICPRIR